MVATVGGLGEKKKTRRKSFLGKVSFFILKWKSKVLSFGYNYERSFFNPLPLEIFCLAQFTIVQGGQTNQATQSRSSACDKLNRLTNEQTKFKSNLKVH